MFTDRELEILEILVGEAGAFSHLRVKANIKAFDAFSEHMNLDDKVQWFHNHLKFSEDQEFYDNLLKKIQELRAVRVSE